MAKQHRPAKTKNLELRGRTSKLDRDDLLKVAYSIQELEGRKSVCPIAAYQPHPGQDALHKSIAPTTLVLTGNRFGKTHSLVADVIACVLGYRPWEVKGLAPRTGADGDWEFPSRNEVDSKHWVRRADGLPIRVPSRVLVCSGLPLARGIGEIVQGKFTSLWPAAVKFKAYLATLGTWQKAVFPNGSEIYFGSAQQTNLSFEGFNADVAFFDEPCPKRVYTAVKRGLIDTNGVLKWTMTPLGDANMAWVAADLLNDPTVRIIKGTSWDNPYLDQEALRRFLDDPTLSEAERKARESGEIACIGQRIVTTFDSKCIVPATDIPSDVPRVLVVDPHHSKPTCLVWAAVYGEGDARSFIIYREWPTQDITKAGVPRLTIHDLAGEIKALEGKEKVEWRKADPQFGVQHAKVHGIQYPSFQEEMAAYELFFDTDVDNNIERGIQKLRDAFRVSPETNKPRVLVMSNCSNTIRALNYWAYEGLDRGRLKPSEHYKDFADIVRYMLMTEYPLFVGSDNEFCYLDNE